MISHLLENIQKVVRLTDRETALFETCWAEKKLSKNEFLLKNGDICHYDSFVSSGSLKAYYINPHSGKEEILFFAIENWWATDLDSFAHRTISHYNIRALEDTELLQIHFHAFERLLQQVPKLERYFRIILQDYTASIQKRIIFQNTYTAEQRYHDFAERYPGILRKVPLYLVASYLGMTPEFLSRIRSRK